MNREAAIPLEEVREELGPKRRFRPHPEYKDSGIEWLGQVPRHWEEKPLKHVVRINSEKLTDSTPADYLLDYVDIGNVSLVNGITSTEKYFFDDAPSRARRRVRDGDTIISTVRTYLKAVAGISHPPDNLVVSTGFAVLRPGPSLDAGYLYRFAQSETLVQCVVAHSVGVSYPAINASDIGSFSIPLPPLEEQRAIAAFLDRETARIDELSAKKERLIELLQEKRTALISHAVTKGLNPDAPMKDSDIDWLGQIPEHWEEWSLGHLGTFRNGINKPAESYGHGIRFVTVNNLYLDGFIEQLSLNRVDVSLEELKTFQVLENDILMTRSSVKAEGVGNPAVMGAPHEQTVFSGFVIRFRIKSADNRAPFIYRILCSSGVRGLVVASANTVAQTNLSQPALKVIKVPLPPAAEQEVIIRWLDREIGQLDALVTHIHDAIQMLHEYRSALISAAVTGKIDVRECV